MTGTEFQPPGPTESVEQWCRANNMPVHEGRVRYMEFVILACISYSRKLSSALVFKGGNALRFVYQSPRSTRDLDFTVAPGKLSDDEDEIRRTFDTAMKWGLKRYNIKAKCQSVKRKPPTPEKTRPTYEIKIGYQFQADRYFADFEGRNVSTAIPVEISFGDLVCNDKTYIPDGSGAGVRVCTLEDIAAEKLRALLQQPRRNRNRKQDVFDLARINREFSEELDLADVSRFFREKCNIRDVQPERIAFDETVRIMAELDYEKSIMAQAPNDFIPFDEAWELVMDLVNRLDL